MWAGAFARLDRHLRAVEPHFPRRWRESAIAKAVDFVMERLNGEDGLGAIYPAMANSVMMFACLGYPKDDPSFVIAKRSIKKLLVLEPSRSYCQPCVSPVWDTGLVCHALLEAGGAKADAAVTRGLDWLEKRQILDVKGDWAEWRPHLRPGCRALPYPNPPHPDVHHHPGVSLGTPPPRTA